MANYVTGSVTKCPKMLAHRTTSQTPQRVQRVEGGIIGIVGAALLSVLPHGGIVTMGVASRGETWNEQ